MKGLVAIVGRPNVGKSTIFNQLTHTRDALVDNRPGVTRDRVYGVVDCEEGVFGVIDTGGFEEIARSNKTLSPQLIWQQTEFAIEEADLVILVFDGSTGFNPDDEHLFRYLQERSVPMLVVINKMDATGAETNRLEFFRMGCEDFHLISAAHNRGVIDLREKILERLAAGARGKKVLVDENATRIAFIGKPNVGKSSLMNRLLGRERSIVSPVPGTTRDVLSSAFQYNNRRYTLLDTAGLRKKSRTSDKIEILAAIKSVQAIHQADVVVLVLDATLGFNEQDLRLLRLALEKHKPTLIVANKWDLVPNKETKTTQTYIEDLHERISFARFVPILLVSCLENQRVFKIMAEVEKLTALYEKRVTTAEINRALQRITHEHSPAMFLNHQRAIKFYFAAQIRAKPPTIVIKCNFADELQPSYKRYMHKKLQNYLGFDEVPLQLIFRGKKDERGEDQAGAGQ